MSNKIKIGISIGDVNGIGLEVILKTLANNSILDYCTPIVYGHTKVASYHRKALGLGDFSFNVINDAEAANPKKANMINCWEEDVKIELGVANEIGGKYALLSLERATEDLIKGNIDALVTAPINKHTIQAENFKFPGHTEYLQERTGSSDVLMFLLSEDIRVGVVTGHIPVSKIAESITKESIVKKLLLINKSLKRDFWIEKPRIAVLGLNPHAGDNGLLGSEEQDIIMPAIQEAFDSGVICFGPYPADGFFGKGAYKQFDAVLAMYHDQGLIPFKTIAFGTGVNFTAGMKYVRTSPDHGTGFDIAGKDLADPSSFIEALFAATHIVKHRREQDELLSNQLRSGGKIIETAADVKDDAN
ncbi:4-hydroxythreonine-4-phosphate dehydrogenase [Pedobacter cryoconitis]|uniref:4-hydroxythreonine-4-phosphate dehydrogenase n=1 Tax=Pedobacter cryoconitis TaxID=188932 RepID=A0A7W8YYH6_9SPHI|nr:4-hydroxythreonine-4-phosphate dehydrogenase PdxA [Pedobacter cryoconitis]MBB5624164.1 4-hydroxythreonine-4-phosphate dehydrogenase [Pedobacter cryoconitis]MBB5647409.1 4-hydroxythreonine-4-phosphate dehydrogenase [Pedobacter cryoconitis]